MSAIEQAKLQVEIKRIKERLIELENKVKELELEKNEREELKQKFNKYMAANILRK